MRANQNSLLAIDPGTQFLGYAAFDSAKLVDFGVKSIRQGGLPVILEHVEDILTRMLVEKQPSVLVFERNQFSQATSNYRLIRVIQKIESLSKAHRVTSQGLNARTIRRIVTGNGNARKLDAAKSVMSRFPETRYYLRGRTGSQERYFGNMFDAIACGVAFRQLHPPTATDAPPKKKRRLAR
jgi:Holliday junction resolvasome RuvABC endonuclease subunit